MGCRLIVIVIILLLSKTSIAQKQDSHWIMGTLAELYFNDTSQSNPIVSDGVFNMITNSNSSSICNKLTGNLLIYTNGCIIYNKNGVPMENGDSINKGKYSWIYYPDGTITFSGTTILPFPNHDSLFYVVYNNQDSLVPGRYIASHLYYSLVDMSYNNGLGKVVQKDIVLLNEWLEGGRINAIQHANGRDWWITINGNNETKHYTFLLDPSGIKLYSTQIIGALYSSNIQRDYSTCVNQSGTQIAYCYGTHDAGHHHRLDFYDFDRCTGLLSNYYYKSFIDTIEPIGCAFSPNDSLFFISNLFYLYQYNLKNKFDTNRTFIDSFDINVHDPFNVALGAQKLAPDNKIYMGTWNGSRQLHCITKPNIRGKGCDFIQGYLHTDSSNHYFQGSVPNYPNFRLGALKGSECDTIRETPALPVTDELLIYPNPNNGSFKIVNGKSNIKQVEIYSVLGQLVLKQNYNAALAVEINVKELPKSMYIVLVKNTEGAVSKAKLIKQ